MTASEFKIRYSFDPTVDLIAEGTLSRVFKAKDTLLQREIAIKLFRKELVAGTPLMKELSRAGVFFHPQLCAIYDLIEIAETNLIGAAEQQPIGVIEYMNGGSIVAYIQQHRDQPTLVKKLLKDVIKGLVYLHSMGKPHLDIKPGNVLVKLSDEEPVAKITDFLNTENLAHATKPIAINPQSISYRAPESFDHHQQQIGAAADIWSLGLLVYEAISGEPLFYQQGDTVERVIHHICYSDYWAAVHKLPEPYLSFVKRCLVHDVAKRTVSLEELILILDGYGVAEPFSVSETTSAELTTPSSAASNATSTLIPTRSSTPARRLGLSIFIILGALIMLTGISAFIYKVINEAPAVVGATAAINPTPTKVSDPVTRPMVDTTKIAILVDTLAHQDTTRVIPIQQKPVVTKQELKKIIAAKPIATSHISVEDKPTLPAFANLYADKPYYFDLKTSLASTTEYELLCENAAITPLGKNTFYVKPIAAGGIYVMVLDKKSHEKLAERAYTVKAKMAPVAVLGDDILGGMVSPKILLSKLTLQAKSESGSYKIRSFRMTCKSGSCDIDDVSKDGAFNESMVKFLHRVKSGEKLYFDNIIAEDENGETVKLNNLQVTTY